VCEEGKRKKDLGLRTNREIKKIEPDRAPGRAITTERKRVGITFHAGRITDDSRCGWE
jgi:hypothetical protein